MKIYNFFFGKSPKKLKFFLILLLGIILISLPLVQLNPKTSSLSQIVISSPIVPKTFNPAFLWEFPPILNYLYEGLIIENDRGDIEPALAKSWEISADNKKIIFTLRTGLKWSDGQDLTADDVIFTYNDLYLNPDIPTDFSELLTIGQNRILPTVKKLDKWRVQFTLPEPFTPFLRNTKFPILPAHALRQAAKEKDEQGNSIFLLTWGVNTPPENIIVNGAYKIQNYLVGERIILEKNPYYWRKDAQNNKLPYIERIVSEIVDSTTTALIQFRSGALDYVDVPTDFFSLLKREEKKGNFTVYNGGTSTFISFLSFNLNKASRNGKPLVDPIKSGWFNRVEFRQAVAYAINREQMLNNIYRGLGQLQDSLIAVQSPYYFSAEQGLKTYEYNLEKARKLLIKGGFHYNNQGQLLDEQGNIVRFRLLTNANNKIREFMGTQIKQNLSKIGIQVDLQALDNSLFFAKILNYWDWECIVFGSSAGVEPHDLANIWLPEGNWHYFNRKPKRKAALFSGYEVTDWEKKIGELYIQAAGESDEAKRRAIYAETQQIAQEYLPFIYLVTPLGMGAARNSIQGMKYSSLQGAFWNIYELKVVDE